MTHDELMALRDVTPYFGQREETRAWQRVVIPVRSPEPGGNWFVADDQAPLFVTDERGIDWQIGELNGQRVRRRLGW